MFSFQSATCPPFCLSISISLYALLLLLLSLLWFLVIFSISPFYRCIAMHFKCTMDGNTMEEIGLFVFVLIFGFLFLFLWCLCDKFTPYCRSLCVSLFSFLLCRSSPIHFILKYVVCSPTKQYNNQSKNCWIRKKAKPFIWSLFGGFIDSFWLNVFHGWFHACVRVGVCDCKQFG